LFEKYLFCILESNRITVKTVLRGHIWDKVKCGLLRQVTS
jgi:hypothetical protein